MEQVRKLEKSLANLYKDLPPLPKNAKESLANAWPWIALVLGVLQLAAAWSLWRLYDRVQPLVDYANQFSQYYRGTTIGYSAFDKLMIYVAIASLLVEGVLLVMAFSPLKRKLKRGWDLLFLSVLLNVVYAVITIFIDGRGAGSFIFNLLGTAVGLYFLFQIRDQFGGNATVADKPKVV